MSGATHSAPKRIPLPPWARTVFDKLRATTPPLVLAARLGVSVCTIENLSYGGLAQAKTVAKVCAVLGGPP